MPWSSRGSGGPTSRHCQRTRTFARGKYHFFWVVFLRYPLTSSKDDLHEVSCLAGSFESGRKTRRQRKLFRKGNSKSVHQLEQSFNQCIDNVLVSLNKTDFEVILFTAIRAYYRSAHTRHHPTCRRGSSSRPLMRLLSSHPHTKTRPRSPDGRKKNNSCMTRTSAHPQAELNFDSGSSLTHFRDSAATNSHHSYESRGHLLCTCKVLETVLTSPVPLITSDPQFARPYHARRPMLSDVARRGRLSTLAHLQQPLWHTPRRVCTTPIRHIQQRSEPMLLTGILDSSAP